MKKKFILPFLFIGLVFSIGMGMLLSQRSPSPDRPFASHQWSQLERIDELKAVLKGFEIKSLIDTSCEEAGMMQKLDVQIEQYIGIDRRKELVDAIRTSMGSAKRTFLARDISRDLLPEADLILCWDSLQTLPLSQVRSSLLLFKKSGSKYLLATHYPDLRKNQKCKKGQYRPINWTLPPYCFPEPMVQVSEQKEGPHTKSLALWKLSELP